MEYSETYAEMKAYFAEAKAEAALKELETIHTQHNENCFRVAIVGGFSQGKTYFLNKLVENEVFPTAVTPETALIYEVRYAEDARAVLSRKGVEQNIPLTKSSLGALSAANNEFAQGDYVRAYLPCNVLEHNVILYDTPGIDDVLESRALLTLSLLSQCDAAIVVISAIAPLSLLERKFIETYLMHRAIPKLAILVNYCEQVPKDSLSKQLDFIQKRAEKLAPNAELWILSEKVSAETFHAVGICEIQARISHWGSSCGKSKRDQRDLLRMGDVLRRQLEAEQTQINLLGGDLALCKSKLKRALDELNHNGDVWRTLLRDFLDHGNAAALSLTDQVEHLAKELLQDLDNAEANKIFIDSVHTRLTDLRDSISTDIQRHIQEDLHELASKIQDAFGFALTIDDLSLPKPEFNLELPILELSNTENSSLTIFGFEGTTILHTILSFFIKDNVMIAKISEPIIAALNSILLGKSIDDKENISTAINKFSGILNLAITQNMRLLYEDVAKKYREIQKIWYEDSYQNIHEIKDELDLQNKINELENLYNKGSELYKLIV